MADLPNMNPEPQKYAVWFRWRTAACWMRVIPQFDLVDAQVAAVERALNPSVVDIQILPVGQHPPRTNHAP